MSSESVGASLAKSSSGTSSTRREQEAATRVEATAQKVRLVEKRPVRAASRWTACPRGLDFRGCSGTGIFRASRSPLSGFVRGTIQVTSTATWRSCAIRTTQKWTTSDLTRPITDPRTAEVRKPALGRAETSTAKAPLVRRAIHLRPAPLPRHSCRDTRPRGACPGRCYNV
jgi:hypothetical protein